MTVTDIEDFILVTFARRPVVPEIVKAMYPLDKVVSAPTSGSYVFLKAVKEDMKFNLQHRYVLLTLSPDPATTKYVWNPNGGMEAWKNKLNFPT